MKNNTRANLSLIGIMKSCSKRKFSDKNGCLNLELSHSMVVLPLKCLIYKLSTIRLNKDFVCGNRSNL